MTFYLDFDFLLSLLLSYHGGFVRQHEFSLSNRSFAQWFGDSVTALIFTLVIGALMIWLPF